MAKKMPITFTTISDFLSHYQLVLDVRSLPPSDPDVQQFGNTIAFRMEMYDGDLYELKISHGDDALTFYRPFRAPPHPYYFFTEFVQSIRLRRVHPMIVGNFVRMIGKNGFIQLLRTQWEIKPEYTFFTPQIEQLLTELHFTRTDSEFSCQKILGDYTVKLTVNGTDNGIVVAMALIDVNNRVIMTDQNLATSLEDCKWTVDQFLAYYF